MSHRQRIPTVYINNCDVAERTNLGLDPNKFPYFVPVVTTLGSHTGPVASLVTINTVDNAGNAIAGVKTIRVRICNSGVFANSTNATIAAHSGTTLVDTATATKDLILKSDTNGVFKVDVTDATAETVTLRTGPAPIGGAHGDYSASVNIVVP